ncbi:tRNA (5-methylaminomethyl-2-thiouridine)(34)-methyltransferase MnmD [Dysgonomonas sp. ZJ279]|uniref:tRNA (5-methylaminomethyl-2-thiouridine)(34)-methyltransferase MnmD n=1 Tax=Dysgonomonas sp. ZJ279 TaxID=2709796 RepID=UPI0013EA3697|nr:tRNA (5-methylaminomethyl-2-thiouridine)(34)-methyltransferase MnmD [Dysgonomonas sp. ZJ279]
MSVKRQIELTADGSHTLFVPELDEHYHSVNGAIQESKHVFIDTGLHHCQKNDVHVFEVGFGTGLNAFLTLLDSQKSGKTIHYTAIEAYPLSLSIINQLNYAQSHSLSDRMSYEKMHSIDWGLEAQIVPNYYLKKIEADFTQFDFTQINKIDLIYFDAFAPDKQADMWTQHLFDKLYGILNNDGILVTYCAKGIVRRMMQQAGFTTERLPGPPGKREMLRATKHL